jgi:hypothetical protein
MPPVNKLHIIYSCSSKQGTNQHLAFKVHPINSVAFSPQANYPIQTTAVKSCDLFRFPTLNDDTTTTFNDETTSHLAGKVMCKIKAKTLIYRAKILQFHILAKLYDKINNLFFQQPTAKIS